VVSRPTFSRVTRHLRQSRDVHGATVYIAGI
jgi:hypothetical protein